MLKMSTNLNLASLPVVTNLKVESSVANPWISDSIDEFWFVVLEMSDNCK
jgi:hypothetical protein